MTITLILLSLAYVALNALPDPPPPTAHEVPTDQKAAVLKYATGRIKRIRSNMTDIRTKIKQLSQPKGNTRP